MIQYALREIVKEKNTGTIQVLTFLAFHPKALE